MAKGRSGSAVNPGARATPAGAAGGGSHATQHGSSKARICKYRMCLCDELSQDVCSIVITNYM